MTFRQILQSIDVRTMVDNTNDSERLPLLGKCRPSDPGFPQFKLMHRVHDVVVHDAVMSSDRPLPSERKSFVYEFSPLDRRTSLFSPDKSRRAFYDRSLLPIFPFL